MIDRRAFLEMGGAGVALAALGYVPAARAANALRFGPEREFSFSGLMQEARALSAQPYAPPATAAEELLRQIDYDAWGAIRFRTDNALFADGPGAFPITFFALGRYFTEPVAIYAVSGGADNASARQIVYRADYFDIPAGNPARRLPKDVGFAGFRVQESRFGDQEKRSWRTNDWAAFLGASYFRAIGALYQYGLSARGIAVNTAVANTPEEFPRFSRFYLAEPDGKGHTVTVYALLEGPSVTGAYRFDLTRDRSVLIDVDAHIFLRRDVERLGIAPLTSMYWFSETRKKTAVDWRPEVHDSDGLALWTGVGEHIWRPLANPDRVAVASFIDNNPRGFGLSQRDRDFDHYLDGVHYGRRPTLWVAPAGDWGKGSVQLVELPTDSEYHDNIVAMWVPQAPARAGDAHHVQYKMYWTDDEPFAPAGLARCQATRLGLAFPEKPERHHIRRFVVEFQGEPLEKLAAGEFPEAVVSASRGKLSRIMTEAVPDGVAGHWRAWFDLAPDGAAPSELRLYLRFGKKPLSETWLYTYRPF